jgi:acyl-CoA synthetase (NDP forming)
MSKSLAQLLFNPATIALIGASGDPKKYTSRPQRYLKRHGYQGQLIPVNPARAEIFGDKAYPDVTSIPGEVDHAFVMVPAKAVPEAVRQCVAKKIPVVTVYSDGFAETGAAGRAKQEKLVAIAKKGGVRLIGPNCIGLFSSAPSCALSVNAVLEKLHVTPGPLAIVSQSGSMMGGLLSRGLGRGVGFSKLISVGNECDLGVGEIGAAVEVLLGVEADRDARRDAAICPCPSPCRAGW